MRRLHRSHHLIARPILIALCRLRGHDHHCLHECCWDNDRGRRFCWRCLRWIRP